MLSLFLALDPYLFKYIVITSRTPCYTLSLARGSKAERAMQLQGVQYCTLKSIA